MRKYTPVFIFDCSICGGRNVMISAENPADKRYKCNHHGVDESSDDFKESGIAKIGDKFRFNDFVIVKSSSIPSTLDNDFAKEEAETLDLDESPAYSDYFEVVVKGRDMKEVAEERGVKRGTVYSNVRHAKDMLTEDEEK